MPFNSLSRSLVLQKSPDLEDLVNFTLECCHSGGTFDEIESTNKFAIPQKQQELQPDATDANKGRWKSNRRGGYGVTSSLRKTSTSLRKSSTSLISSFTKMAGGRADAGADAAALVSAEFYEEEEKMEKDKVSERTEIKASNSTEKIFSTMKLSLSNSNKSKSKMGDCPSGATTRSCTPSLEEDIALQVGTSVTEYLEECLSAEVTVLDREKFKSVPEYIKSDFAITAYLGKGSYSDCFEVSITVPIYENEGVGGNVSSMKKKLKTGNMLSRIESSADLEDLKGQEEEDIDKLIEGLGNLGKLTSSAVNPIIPTVVPRNYEPAKSALATSDIGSLYPARRRASTNRRGSLSGSANAYTIKKTTRSDERRVIYAMKCLRPTARSDFEHFTIGAEDLVHETAMLASLDHPNIVKLHGRAAGNLSNAFKLNDGYFVLLDRLKDTLDDRIVGWKKSSSGCADQIEVAHSITNAMSYLHSKNIVFRDLKPANVGFDQYGVLKLFDFGFAIGIPAKAHEDDPTPQLFDRCGTPRYMAPEVGLELGYGIQADVYSFGIVFWEMCSTEKPFAHVKSHNEFNNDVFVKGMRPDIGERWNAGIQQIMTTCWDKNPSKRPTMSHVNSLLTAMMNGKMSNHPRRMRSASFKRLSWDL